ncbi:thymidylate synthase (FAD), partial [bacterium]|nr:thymidylate synthase (FAD) [bacterium]
MKVKLISYSQTNPGAFSDDEFTDYPRSAQDLVAFCARVSNPTNQFNLQTSEKLLAYLIKHKHWSPFEMVSACLEITTTRDIARQMLRHRSFSFQEFSQRYADPVKELDFVLREAR